MQADDEMSEVKETLHANFRLLLNLYRYYTIHGSDLKNGVEEARMPINFTMLCHEDDAT